MKLGLSHSLAAVKQVSLSCLPCKGVSTVSTSSGHCEKQGSSTELASGEPQANGSALNAAVSGALGCQRRCQRRNALGCGARSAVGGGALCKRGGPGLTPRGPACGPVTKACVVLPKPTSVPPPPQCGPLAGSGAGRSWRSGAGGAGGNGVPREIPRELAGGGAEPEDSGSSPSSRLPRGESPSWL